MPRLDPEPDMSDPLDPMPLLLPDRLPSALKVRPCCAACRLCSFSRSTAAFCDVSVREDRAACDPERVPFMVLCDPCVSIEDAWLPRPLDPIVLPVV
jgi:hypothetical protein